MKNLKMSKYVVLLLTLLFIAFNLNVEAKETKTATVTVNVKDESTKKNIVGAHMSIKDSKGNILVSWVTNGNEHVISGLSFGKYTIANTKASEGYDLVPVKIEVTLDKKNYKQHVILYAKEAKNTGNLIVYSKDYINKKTISGNVFTLKDQNGKTIKRWTSSTKSATINNLQNGTYYIYMSRSANGYLKTAPKKVVIKNGTTKVTLYSKRVVNKISGIRY